MEQDEEMQSWSLDSDYVQRALSFIRKRGARGVTAELMVQWDSRNGRKLFNWNDQQAAEEWRLHQARRFLNSFRGVFERMCIRKFIHIPEGEETGLTEGRYLDVETISRDDKLRTWAIGDIMRRIERQASQLQFWRLEEAEREAIISQFRSWMNGKEKAA